MESVNEQTINSNMDIEEEILDFEEAIDFNFSDNPDALNTELLDESMLDLDGTMDFNIDEPLEKRASTSTENEKNAQQDTNNISNNNNDTEADKVDITPPPDDDPEELKLGLDDEFDPDFFKEFGSGDIIENDGNLADDEFWKEIGLDPLQDILDNDKADTNNTEKVEKLETDDIEVKSSQKDEIKKHDEMVVPKEEESKETKKSDTLSVSKSIPSTKSPEKEDGEIPTSTTATTTSDNRQQQQKKQPTQSQPQSGPVQKPTQQQRSSNQRQTSQQQSNHTQQSNQNFRRSGIRRNNDWRPGNTGGEFFNGTFRTGFGPGMEGMPGMPMGQIPMGNPMIPNLSGPIIGPNIHVNPNFARLRPHAFPFANPVTQFQPIGSGGPHMNMMPYQNQMEIPPFHPSMGPMVGGRGGNNNSFSRGGSTFNHHNAMSSRRQVNQQQSNNNNNNQNQRTIPSSLSKRKTPADGFEQKEPANKRNATNGKSVVQDNKDNNKSNASNTVDRTNKTANTTSEKTLKSGIPTLATNKEPSLSSIKTKSNSNLATSGSASNSKPTSAKSVLKQVQRPVKNNSIKSQTVFNTSSNVKSVAKSSVKPPSAQNTTSKPTLSSSKPVTSSSKPATSLKSTLSKSTTQITSNAKSVNEKSASNTTTNNTTTTNITTNAANAGGKVLAASNKLKISNVGDSVTKRELQSLASAVPGGFSLITLERVDNSAEITFKTLDGARIFRRKHNRSQLGGSNVVINFS
ncbi:hypothetical protein Glove_487g15 [Diversispora epigaea]|uniref:RRM domain-containing protein n=1 Tax=Diversispora epigaea TaxID=1348612 RepID=A0A397GIY2_9GLOM|nr:hypothetical protein Glove_487g15 [Diversispora epigaea]